MTEPLEKQTPLTPLQAMDPEERIAFCRQVMEGLSDLVEGEAPADFCRRVEEVLGQCQPYLAYRNTLEATIRLARECGECADRGEDSIVDEERFRACVEQVRRRLAPP